tara:strand:- start:697 stop:993 length:297 start_codon:yes stop_codon:yes gene_type:complete
MQVIFFAENQISISFVRTVWLSDARNSLVCIPIPFSYSLAFYIATCASLFFMFIRNLLIGEDVFRPFLLTEFEYGDFKVTVTLSPIHYTLISLPLPLL